MQKTADLAGAPMVQAVHVAEALSLRALDRAPAVDPPRQAPESPPSRPAGPGGA